MAEQTPATGSAPAETPRPPTPVVEHPRPLGSLVASAKRLTSRTMKRGGSNAKSWQEDAWEMYDLVGEERFLATTLAGRLAQARFFVGIMPDEQTEDPVPVDNPAITGILDAIGDNAAARAQLIFRLGINLFVAGDGWLAGIPRHLFPPALLSPQSLSPEPIVIETPPEFLDATMLSIDDLEWRMLSVSEVSSSATGQVTLRLGDGEGEKIECSPDEVFLIRVWRPHPRRWWEADSPTRSSLPVLRELVGLTMHISAQVDSRLAGAGLLLVPQSAQRALRVAAGLTEDDDSDPFTEALMDAMLTPINDRANASALVPLVAAVPDEAVALFRHLTFDKPLDTEARPLREEAIRRLALGQDAPPELLLGTAGMNHWGAWLVQEDVVTTHLEPPLALICDALTTQYLWPVLIEQGMSAEIAHSHVIWYDVSDLVVRPNRASDAKDLHARGVISDTALRDATGFDETDAPLADATPPLSLDPAATLALELCRTQPHLFSDPGLPQVVSQIRAVLSDQVPLVPDTPIQLTGPQPAGTPPAATPTDTTPAVTPPPPPPTGPPATKGAPAPELPTAASADLVGV